MTWMAVIGTILLIITFFTTKERIVPKEEESSSVKEDFSYLIKNIPWIIILSVTTLIFITLSMRGGSALFYFKNYVIEENLSEFLAPLLSFINNIGIEFFNDIPSAGFGIFNGGGIIFMILGISLSKPLADRFGKRNIFGLFLFISTLFILIFYFFKGDQIALIFISQILHGFFYGITIPLLWAMIADVADYSEWKFYKRATALIFSAMMVGLKVGLSIGGGLITKILSEYGYSSDLEVQSEQAINGTKMLMSVYPSIPFLIAVALLFFYSINKETENKIEKDLLDRRIK
jgi:Na+/melibiose symporter-like transporter